MKFKPGDKVRFTNEALINDSYKVYFGDMSRVFTIKGSHDDHDRLWLNTHDESDYWSVSEKDIILESEPTVVSTKTAELRGKVLLIPLKSSTVVVKITDSMVFRYTENYIYIKEKQRVPFDQKLLDGIISVLNNDGPSPLQQILNQG